MTLITREEFKRIARGMVMREFTAVCACCLSEQRLDPGQPDIMPNVASLTRLGWRYVEDSGWHCEGCANADPAIPVVRAS